MNKRILSILLCLLLVASLLVLAVPAGAAPTERMQLKVVADKESAKAGDTVAFQIVLGPVTQVGSIQMAVDIPAGLTYSEGTAVVPEGVVAAVGHRAGDGKVGHVALQDDAGGIGVDDGALHLDVAPGDADIVVVLQ